MKVIISDFDGTLYFNRKVCCVDKINKFVDDGNIFIIATGRNISYLKSDLDKSNLKCNYYICNDGALIYDQFFNVVYRMDIDKSVVRAVYNFLKDDDNLVEVLIDTGNGYVNDTSRSANKIIARYFNKDKAQETVNKLNNQFTSIYGYLGNTSVNVTKKTETKGNAISFLGEYYNLYKYDIYVIGNAINDLSMIKDDVMSYGVKSEDNFNLEAFDKQVNSFEDAFDYIVVGD